MSNKQTSTDITRRKALKIGAVAVVGAAAFGLYDQRWHSSEINKFKQ